MNSEFDEIRAARQELDEVIEEIRAVPGFEDFLRPPSFDDVASAATAEPLVYLAAAEHGGLALVVRGDDVAPVPLDDLTDRALRDRLATYHTAYQKRVTATEDGRGTVEQEWRDELDAVTGWLWDVAMGPVIAALRPTDSAVLVAGGLLGLLPLHAAWTSDDTAPTGRRYALDEMLITYAPNARSLKAARAVASGTDTALLAVVDTSGSLPFAPVETEVVAASFPGATQVDAAGADAVGHALRAADIAHFACHGSASPSVPLNSGLDLADGERLTVRQIMALRTTLRLVVLSACETMVPGTELPDEVVGLPTALLQAGAGGVVGSLWIVGDESTTLLMAEFYRRWRWARTDPRRALREAQIWLRDATNGDIVRAYRAAADDGAGWLTDGMRAVVLGVVAFRDPSLRHYDGIAAWAGFGYVGA